MGGSRGPQVPQCDPAEVSANAYAAALLKTKLKTSVCDPLAAEKVKKKVQADPRTAEIYRLKEQLDAAKRAERRTWATSTEQRKKLKTTIRRLKLKIKRLAKQLATVADVETDKEIQHIPAVKPIPVYAGMGNYTPTMREKAVKALPYAACGVTAGVIGYYALRGHPVARTLAYSLAIGLLLYGLDLII